MGTELVLHETRRGESLAGATRQAAGVMLMPIVGTLPIVFTAAPIMIPFYAVAATAVMALGFSTYFTHSLLENYGIFLSKTKLDTIENLVLDKAKSRSVKKKKKKSGYTSFVEGIATINSTHDLIVFTNDLTRRLSNKIIFRILIMGKDEHILTYRQESTDLSGSTEYSIFLSKQGFRLETTRKPSVFELWENAYNKLS